MRFLARTDSRARTRNFAPSLTRGTAVGTMFRVEGDKREVRMFATFSPVAIALIGKLPETLADRSVSVALKRRLPNERVTRFRADRVDDLQTLARKAIRWAKDNAVRLKDSYQPPEDLTRGGFPSSRKRDSMQHVVDSRSGQHVGNRDYTPIFRSCGRRRRGRLTPSRRGAFWRLPWCWMSIRVCWRRRPVVDRQTLRDWVHRYNADGLAGLADRPRPGRQPRLAEAQLSEVAKWVEDGPDPKTDGVVRWRRADLRDRIAAKFNIHLHERSVGKLQLDFSSISVRPMHPQTDLEAQEAFKKTSPSWHAPRSRAACRPAG